MRERVSSSTDAWSRKKLDASVCATNGAVSGRDEGDESAQADAIIAGLLGLYRAAPALHRVLAIDGLRIGPTERVQDFDRRMIEALRAFFDITSFSIRRKNHHAAAFVLYHSVRATLLASIFEGSLVMPDEVLVEEVTGLVVTRLVG